MIAVSYTHLDVYKRQISGFLQLELEHEGYSAHTAQEGREGYKKASSGKYDIIILDLMLPNLSGIETVSYTHLIKLTFYAFA